MVVLPVFFLSPKVFTLSALVAFVLMRPSLAPEKTIDVTSPSAFGSLFVFPHDVLTISFAKKKVKRKNAGRGKQRKTLPCPAYGFSLLGRTRELALNRHRSRGGVSIDGKLPNARTGLARETLSLADTPLELGELDALGAELARSNAGVSLCGLDVSMSGTALNQRLSERVKSLVRALVGLVSVEPSLDKLALGNLLRTSALCLDGGGSLFSSHCFLTFLCCEGLFCSLIVYAFIMPY